MKKQLLTHDDIYKGTLILVNSNYEIKSEVMFDYLEPFNSEYNNVLLEKTANKFLQTVLNKVKASDKIIPVSGYRSLSEQEDIYFSSIRENGEDFTKKYVAFPNTSEHQTGLAIDLGLNEGKIDFIRPSFPYSGICNEFRNFAYEYGFIERYKKDKENITNISSEEWHFRYVGYPHSIIIKENNFCLEEYIEYLKQYEMESLKYNEYEIFYIPYNNSDIELLLDNVVSISGNNIDGFIITRKNDYEKLPKNES